MSTIPLFFKLVKIDSNHMRIIMVMEIIMKIVRMNMRATRKISRMTQRRLLN